MTKPGYGLETEAGAPAKASEQSPRSQRQQMPDKVEEPEIVVEEEEDNHNHFTPENVSKSLVAGGVAGMVAKTTVAPLDRVKILLQAQSMHYKHLGVMSALRQVVVKEGVLALYRGNGAQMVRIFPYGAIQFTSYEYFKKKVNRIEARLWGGKGAKATAASQHSHYQKFVAGAAAGVSSVTVTFPLDTIRARLAFQTKGEHRYRGILHTATKIVKEENGFRGLYRGIVPTYIGMVPYAGFSFYMFEKLKHLCVYRFPKYTCSYNEKEATYTLNLTSKLLCGAFGGAMAHTFSYPLDVARRRMQLAMMKPETEKFAQGTWSTLRLIYTEDGLVRGLFRGLSINYLRAVPTVSISFTVNELMKQAMNVETGLKIVTG